MKITSFIKIATTAGAALTLSAMTAFAVDATATVELNVRTGPGTSFGVIDTLAYGEHVNTTECVSSGWCYIEQAQQNGWVSSSYLLAVPPPSPTPSTPAPDCTLRLTLGGGSPRLELVCTPAPGTTPPPTTPPPTTTPPPVGAEACFYRKPNYLGASFCYAPGQLNSLNGAFNDRIRSIRINGAVTARVCVNNNLGGYCRDISSSAPAIGALIDNRISSLKVFGAGGTPTPPPPPPTPTTFRTGGLSIATSYTADFDAGTTGTGGADVWYTSARRLKTTNGGMLALGDGSNRGYAGCSIAAFSHADIPRARLTVGTYVCAKTNQGRISQFRINSFTGSTMNIGFTTWAN